MKGQKEQAARPLLELFPEMFPCIFTSDVAVIQEAA